MSPTHVRLMKEARALVWPWAAVVVAGLCSGYRHRADLPGTGWSSQASSGCSWVSRCWRHSRSVTNFSTGRCRFS